MMEFLLEAKARNATLFYCGWACLAAALLFFVLSKTTDTEVYGVSAWYKPLKFALSTWAYAWAMGWYCHHLADFNVSLFNGTVMVLLGFEVVYIAWMAGRGEVSHYNTSTPVAAALFTAMALAASAVTLYTLYVGVLFLRGDFPELPVHYVWAIRLGLLLFVVFAFEGFAMGGRMSHTVGAENDNSNLFLIGWSRTVGDLRVAHFIGMHALQALPLVAHFLLKSTRATAVVAVCYGLLAVSTLVQALQGKPLIPAHTTARSAGSSRE